MERTAWTCAADIGGGTGSVTQVDTGTGLTGGPITTTGTVAIAAGGVGTTQLADNAVSTAKIANAAVATAKIQDAAVTAAKIAPGAISSPALGAGIASARPPYVEQAIDVVGTGRFSSIVVGADGLPLIAYYAQSSGDLKVAHCDTVDCASTTITTIDSAGDVGQYVTAVVQTTGLPAIAYHDVSNTALKIAFCDNVRCTSATFATVDGTNDVGKYASIGLNETGFPRISYFDETLDDLKFAQCGSAPCSSASVWTVSTPVSTGNVGRGTAMTVSFSNETLIAYYDATLNAVRLARCTTSLCDAPALVTVKAISAGRVAEAFAMTLNHGGAPVISFVDRVAGGSGSLNIAVCESVACAAPTIQTGGGTNLELGSTGVTVTADNLPIAIGGSNVVGGNCDAASSGSFSGTPVKCLDAQCGSSATDNPAFAAGGSMTLNSTGYPVYSYQRCGSSGARLNLAHCATMTCLGHIRPR